MNTQTYIWALNKTAGSNAEFDELIAELRADRTIRQTELLEIAIAFLGYEVAKSKSRKWLLQQIIDRQALSARQDARIAVLDRSLRAW